MNGLFPLTVALFPHDIGHIGFQQKIETLFPVHGVVHKTLVISFPVHFTGHVHGIRFAFREAFFYGVQRERRLNRRLFLRRTRHDRQHLTVDIVHVYAVPLFRKDTALGDIRRVPDSHAVVAADDIGYHVVLLGKDFLVQHLIDHFGIVFRLHAHGDYVARNRVAAGGAGELHEALAARLSAAIAHKGGRPLYAARALQKFVQRESFLVFFPFALH